jgi:hypothetical protein
MGSDGRSLKKAQAKKNDEFYTQIKDIENELSHYKEQFADKVVYCNCDTEQSNFVVYFKKHFDELKLKKLISSSADFRSKESIDLLQSSDIVVTNPPFSLFREFINQLVTYNKKFIIVGNKNAITYKNVFSLMKENKLWLGYGSGSMDFITLNGSTTSSVPAYWYTNVNTKKQNEQINLYKKYNEIEYPTYDNYNAINVNKTKDIPVDYSGEMGVPISFMQKYNPNQFEIIGLFNSYKKDCKEPFIIGGEMYLDPKNPRHSGPRIKGKPLYFRIIIRRRFGGFKNETS